MDAETSRSTILIADDDSDILELLETVLQRAGYGPIPAADGDEALRLARERLPRARILDVVMPGLGGLDVLRALRSEADTAEIPVLILGLGAEPGRRGCTQGWGQRLPHEAVQLHRAPRPARPRPRRPLGLRASGMNQTRCSAGELKSLERESTRWTTRSAPRRSTGPRCPGFDRGRARHRDG